MFSFRCLSIRCSQGATLFVTSLFVLSCVVISQAIAEEVKSDTRMDSTQLTAWLDQRYEKIWSEQEFEVELCDDETFIRRVSLDLIGRIPSVAEVRVFLEKSDPGKRSQLVDSLLVNPEDADRSSLLHAEHLARLWRRVLLPPGSQGAAMGSAFEPWLRQRFLERKAYNEIVRELLTARGEGSADEMIYYQAIGGTAATEASEFSRVFLGIRIGCAQCHDHPFTDWKQSDFWGMAAFFNGTQVGRMPNQLNQPQSAELNDDTATGSVVFEGKTYSAKALWEAEPVSLRKDQRPRDALADWMVSPDNPTFSANAVNRVWQLLLGRGLVSEVDDLDLATDEERGLVLNDLAELFEDSGYDLHWLIAGICKSQVYQCTSFVSPDEEVTLLAGKRPLRTLTPEQIFDSLEQALLLPISSTNEKSARHNGQMKQLVDRFNESSGGNPEEYTASVPQTLLLMNGPLMAGATSLKNSHTLRAIVDAPFLSDAEKIDTLYLSAFTRLPRVNERNELLSYVRRHPSVEDRKQAFGDIFWALLNSPEFVLCR